MTMLANTRKGSVAMDNKSASVKEVELWIVFKTSDIFFCKRLVRPFFKARNNVTKAFFIIRLDIVTGKQNLS